jgi:plasmid replication initiation protein
MADEIQEIEPVNTPESLGVTPRFVLQHNAISRAAHNLSVAAEKLTVMAMALLPADLSSLAAYFTFTDFCKAFDCERGGKSRRIFKEAVDECGRCIIAIESERGWEKFEWFATAAFNEKTGRAAMTLSPDFAAVLRDFKRVYAKLNLLDIGKLKSRYGLRFFELAKSYESLAGKEGNAKGSWYFERAIEELRQLLGIDPDAYPLTNEFRKYVIEQPIKELNNAGLGIEIHAEGIKQGRVLKGIRFNCVKAARTTAANSPLPEPNPKTADNRVEKELQHLQELYPEEFAELYEKALGEVPTLGGQAEGFRMIVAAGKALALLRKRHGVVK